MASPQSDDSFQKRTEVLLWVANQQRRLIAILWATMTTVLVGLIVIVTIGTVMISQMRHNEAELEHQHKHFAVQAEELQSIQQLTYAIACFEQQQIVVEFAAIREFAQRAHITTLPPFPSQGPHPDYCAVTP